MQDSCAFPTHGEGARAKYVVLQDKEQKHMVDHIYVLTLIQSCAYPRNYKHISVFVSNIYLFLLRWKKLSLSIMVVFCLSVLILYMADIQWNLEATK